MVKTRVRVRGKDKGENGSAGVGEDVSEGEGVH